MKKLSYLIVLTLILGLTLTGCLLSNVGQIPTTGQSGITYLTKGFSDLIGLWSFDEESGIIAYDSSGNNNFGTLNNFSGIYWVDDQWGGQALSFDGEDDYVEVTDSTRLDITGDLTIEAWIVADVISTYKSIVVKGDAFAGDKKINYGLQIQAEGGAFGTLRFFVYDSGYKYVDSTSQVLAGQWHHVAVTVDTTAGIVRFYINGSPAGAPAFNTSLSVSTSTLEIGRHRHATEGAYQYFDGKIDEVRIYDYALSADTIGDHYSEGIYGFNGLLAPYAPPLQKAFKAGSTIPLKWQYTDSAGGAVDSANANPVVEWIFMGAVSGPDVPEEGDAPGASGLSYNALARTWQFNWKTTKSFTVGQYDIFIKSNLMTGQTDGPFPIRLK